MTAHWTADERTLRAQLEAGQTVVVNRAKAGPHARLWPWAVQEGLATYVGRPDRWGRWPGSPWANPYPLPKTATTAERLEVIARYARHLEQSPGLLARIGELRGRALGCWCRPLACHADVLAAHANQQDFR